MATMDERVMQMNRSTSDDPRLTSSVSVGSKFPVEQSRNKLLFGGIAVIFLLGVIVAVAMVATGGKSEKVRRSTVKETTTEMITKTVTPVIYSNKTCTTKECFKAARRLKESINASGNPCHDFYNFVCGNWMRRNPLKGIEIRKFTSDVMYDNYKQKISNLLKKTASDNLPRHVEILKTQYDTCVHTGTNVTTGSMYLRNAIQELGGWPVIVGETWEKEIGEFNVTHILAKIINMGLGHTYLFEFAIGPSFFFPNQTSIIIDRPSFVMDDLFYNVTKKEESRVKYIKKIKSVAHLLDLDVSDKNEELEEIFEFEYNMSSHLQDNIKQGWTRQYLNFSRENYEQTTWIHWVNFVSAIIGDTDVNQILELWCFRYMGNLGSLIRSSTNRAIANYLIWRVIQENAPYLEKGKDCEFFLLEYLGIAYSSFYVRTYFNENYRKSASAIIPYLRNVISKDVINIKWMGETSQYYGELKINTTITHFPFPAELLNASLIDHYYEKLNFGNISSVMNLVNIRKWQAQTDYEQLKTNPHISYWKYHVITKEEDVIGQEVFVSLYRNSIYFCSSILQDPVYNEHLPMYMNFGGAGSLISHGLALGLSEAGRWAHAGGYREYWWDPETCPQYYESLQCIIQQYKNYILTDVPPDDALYKTVPKALADQLGFEAAYIAYLKWGKKTGTDDLLLPGLKYTARQMFWINLASTYCCNYDWKYKGSFIATEVPCMHRINGALSNFKHFSDDFHCIKGPTDTMNRDEKCSVHKVADIIRGNWSKQCDIMKKGFI